MSRLLIFIFLVFCLDSNAAYRAYKLKVTFYDPSMKKKVTQTVMSTLDHLQYEHYHAGYGTQDVTLLDTWYCPGDTKGRPICKKPKNPRNNMREIATEPGSAYNKPKRSDIDYNRQPVIP